MSTSSLEAKIANICISFKCTTESGVALITDFLRLLHEIKVKTSDDQMAPLRFIEKTFDKASMMQMAKVLEADISQYGRDSSGLDDFSYYVPLMCRQRNFEVKQGLAVLSSFIKFLDLERYSAGGDIESAPAMVYFAVGPEAAYHFGGLYTGDNRSDVTVELGGYLDPSLKRFHKLVEIWEFEMDDERGRNS